MRRRVGRILLTVAVAALLLVMLGRGLVRWYVDILWYDAIGHLAVYWARLGIELGVRTAAAAISVAIIAGNLWWAARHMGPLRVRRHYGNLEIAERIPRRHVVWAAGVVAASSGWWLAELQLGREGALTVMSWLRHVPWGVDDPVFGHDIGFYIFTLPVVASFIGYLILTLVWSFALVTLGHVLIGGIRWHEGRLSLSTPARRHLGALLATLVLLGGLRYWLGRYFLLVDGTGVAGSLGYTDVRARLPAYWVMAGLSLAVAASLIHGAWRKTLRSPVVALGLLITGGIAVTVAWPFVVQKFQVEPNELSREARYIRWNMEFTRRAYGLDGLERHRFPYRRGARPRPDRLVPILDRLPLWDAEPLAEAFNATQSLYPYYWFPDVDNDRYGPPGREVQVGIGVREFRASDLEAGARTWQSLRLNPSYVRGLGAVVAASHMPAGEERTPELWVRNINPVLSDPAAPPGLDLERPSVFYGETMTEYAVVVPGRDGEFTGESGIDYPAGVPLSSFLRTMAFAWDLGDETLLFSGEVTRDSRILIRRSVRSRLREVVPFLGWDADPLPVIHDGAIVWLVDGYTTSATYPLSRSVSLGRDEVRYLNNAVKAVVHAITGEVSVYAVSDDPMLATYRRIFPGLIQPASAMPAGLRRHLRYPELALLTQAEILQEYHVERVEAFYAGQDTWQQPQETAPGGGIRDYGPLQAVMPIPTENATAFLSVLPFIARARQNMTAVLMARHDAGRYGQLSLLEFPRDQQIPGPGQIQAIIEQDTEIAPELSLVRQRGSGVDMGRLRVVALDSTVVYIQPLYLSADENPIPEIWRIVVSDGHQVRMAPTLDAAMARLDLATVEAPIGVEGRARTPAPLGSGAGQALDLLDEASDRLGDGDWVGYGRAMEALRSLLERLSTQETEQTRDP